MGKVLIFTGRGDNGFNLLRRVRVARDADTACLEVVTAEGEGEVNNTVIVYLDKETAEELAMHLSEIADKIPADK